MLEINLYHAVQHYYANNHNKNQQQQKPNSSIAVLVTGEILQGEGRRRWQWRTRWEDVALAARLALERGWASDNILHSLTGQNGKKKEEGKTLTEKCGKVKSLGKKIKIHKTRQECENWTKQVHAKMKKMYEELKSGWAAALGAWNSAKHIHMYSRRY